MLMSACIRQNVCTSLRTDKHPLTLAQLSLHTSKRMHFIEEYKLVRFIPACRACIRQNVCTSLRSLATARVRPRQSHLHTSKRMHFIEDWDIWPRTRTRRTLHTSKRMHFIEEYLRARTHRHDRHLHTSKRMHFIEEICRRSATTRTTALHTSKRMHFIEEGTVCAFFHRGQRTCIRQNVCTSLRIRGPPPSSRSWALAYVKTYALH